MNRPQATPPLEPARAARLMRFATYASSGTAAALVAAKLGAWLATDAISLLSTLVDSLLDAGASLVNLFAIRHALAPADREHRFGHGKAEALAGLAQAAFITGSAGFLLLEVAQRLIHPVPLQQGGMGVAVMLFSMGVTTALVLFQRHVVSRTGSLAIRADSAHYVGDIGIGVGVIVSLSLSTQLGWLWADPLFALGVALYLLLTARGVARGALAHLMDRELPDEVRRSIHGIAAATPGVLGVHDLRTRSSGVHSFIQLHLELDPELPLIQAHAIADEVMARILAAHPGAEVLIHQDPAGVPELRDRFPKTP